MLRLSCAGESHVGLVRGNNEDSGFAGPYLALVADGVGGAAAGEVASASTTYVTGALSMLRRDDDPLEVLASAVLTANGHLRDGVLADPGRHGMATTLTAVLGDGHRFGLVHVGDSRAYLLRAGTLTRLTRDHTLVQELLDDGSITPEEARQHPHRSVVLRSVDAESAPAPDLSRLDLLEGDRLLLCSDGLTDLVAEDVIADILRNHAAEAAVAALVEHTLAAGARDNVTCVVADVVTSEHHVCPDGQLLGAVRDLANLVDPAAVRRPQPA